MIIQQIKRQESDFQQAIDDYALTSTLRTQLPHVQILSVVELSAGLFNNTYKVATNSVDYILKVAPSHNADVFYNERDLMAREQSIAGRLTQISPLIPEYLSFFEIEGRNSFLQPYVTGRLWHDHQTALTKDENDCLWTQLGAFAKQFHSTEGEKFGYPYPFSAYSKWSEFINANVEGMVHDAHRLNIYCKEIDTYLNLLPSFNHILDTITQPKLLHGDLWPRNVIFDGQGDDIHIKAVFDAERAFWGDPLSDWVLILYGVPEAFWRGYGEDLLSTSALPLIKLYQGMYFILNILEAARFGESDDIPRGNLSKVNQSLREAASNGYV